MGLHIEICQPIEEHARLVMEWRNDPQTLSMFYHREPKVWDSFWPEFRDEYFADDTLPPFFVLDDCERAAFLRFQSITPPAEATSPCVDVSINVAPTARGRGLGTRALRTAKQLRSSWYILFFQLPWLPEKLLGARGAQAIGDMLRRTSCHPERFSDEDLEVFRKAAAQPGALTAMLNYYRMLVQGPGARRQRALGYPVIETPTLMIWGEEDVALSKPTTYGTERYVADLTLRYLPGVSHWVQQDDPEAVNAILEAWLSGEPVP